MTAELVVLLDVLADNDLENDLFGDEEDDVTLFAAASTFENLRNLKQTQRSLSKQYLRILWCCKEYR